MPTSRLTEAIKTGKSYKEVASAPDRYLTSIYQCTEIGIVSNKRFERPLFERVYNTHNEAEEGHNIAMVLLEHSDWNALRALGNTTTK